MKAKVIVAAVFLLLAGCKDCPKDAKKGYVGWSLTCKE